MADTIGTRVRQLILKSASLNDTREQSVRPTQDRGGLNVQGTDITFTAPDTITSAGNAFPTGLAAGMNIEVIGSGVNGRTWQIATASAGTLTVVPAQITSETSGPFIDIRTV